MANPFQWLRAAFAFFRNGRRVPQPVVKAAAQAVVQESRAKMFAASLALQQGSGDVDAWRAEMQSAIKSLHLASAALARGGWANMRPSDYLAQAPRIAQQYKYLEGFADDIAKGRYGKPDALRPALLSRTAQYAMAGTSVYENERTTALQEAGHTQARRILAAADHCADCKKWAALGWIPIEEMQEKYPIGSGICRQSCHCVIVTRRGGKE